MRKFSYCAAQVRSHARDRFLCALFAPEPERETLLAIYALDVELAQVHESVREEVLAHVRYAWWQENLESIAAGQKPRQHPLLQAFDPITAKEALGLVVSYRESYPEMPAREELLDKISLEILSPSARENWQRGHGIIKKHRARFGQKMDGWLMIKLLLAGIC